MKPHNDIKNELSTLSPLLANREKKNPFSVPDNYFSDLDNKIISTLNNESIESELEEAEQLRLFHSRENTFNVPKGYFEQLPGKISARIAVEKKTAVVRNLLAVVSVAAALVIVFLLFKPQDITTIPVNNPIALSSEEIQNYLSANIASLDEQSITGQITNYKPLTEITDIKVDADDFSLIDVSQIDLTTIQNL